MSSDNGKNNYLHLDPRTMRVSVSTLISLTVVLLPLAFGAYHVHYNTIAELKRHVSSEIDRATRYEWTVQDQSRWAELLKYRNPEMEVPDVDQVWEWRRRHMSGESQFLTPWTRRWLVNGDDAQHAEEHP